jgi:hypothetical protein
MLDNRADPALRRKPASCTGSTDRARRARSPASWARTGWARPRLLKALAGTHPRSGGTRDAGGRRLPPGPPHGHGPARAGYRAAGPDDLSAPDRAREPGNRLALPAPKGDRRIPDEISRPVPGPEGHAPPPRGRPVGRAAAATGHRPRHDHAAEGPSAGRADRGHPAQHHPGDRPGDRATCAARATWRSSWSSSISTLPMAWPTRSM